MPGRLAQEIADFVVGVTGTQEELDQLRVDMHRAEEAEDRMEQESLVRHHRQKEEAAEQQERVGRKEVGEIIISGATNVENTVKFPVQQQGGLDIAANLEERADRTIEGCRLD